MIGTSVAARSGVGIRAKKLERMSAFGREWPLGLKADVAAARQLRDSRATWSATGAKLAFVRNIAQDDWAIFSIGLPSATRPLLGRLFQDTHYVQIVRYRATIRAWTFVMEANHGYRNCEIFRCREGIWIYPA